MIGMMNTSQTWYTDFSYFLLVSVEVQSQSEVTKCETTKSFQIACFTICQEYTVAFGGTSKIASFRDQAKGRTDVCAIPRIKV